MSSTNATFHIPFPKNFLAVNTPVKKAAPTALPSLTEDVLAEPIAYDHGFLSNRPAIGRHQSISSVSSITSVATTTAPSEASTISAPSSPVTKAAASPVLGPKIFAPLAVNTKHSLPQKEMSAAERKRRMSFEKHTFLSNQY